MSKKPFDRLLAAYDETHTLVFGDGELLISRRGARVLGCTVGGIDENLFWQPDDLEGFAMGGGDRLWIAPEIAYFWPSVELAREDAAKHARTPSTIDPSDYQFDETSDRHVTLCVDGVALTDCRDNKNIRFDIERQIRAAEPLANIDSNLRTFSFAITNTLTLIDGDEGAVAGAWDLLMLPGGGVLSCPTTQPLVNSPTSYYDPFGDSVQWDDNKVSFYIDGKSRMKMGLTAQQTTGRMGYLRQVGGEAVLIVRCFSTLTGEPYVDLPIHADETERFGGECLQAYSHNDPANFFGEMEHHDPALVVGQSPEVRSGTCVTHIIAGESDAVRSAGEMLLGNQAF